jgi:hypothetical protein
MPIDCDHPLWLLLIWAKRRGWSSGLLKKAATELRGICLPEKALKPVQEMLIGECPVSFSFLA